MGRVRVIFAVSARNAPSIFIKPTPEQDLPTYLAYVEWFTPFANSPDPLHGLYKIKKALRNGVRQAAVVPLCTLRRSMHVYPSFGRDTPVDWTSSNVLDKCSTFFVNSFTDRHAYGIVV